jgi:adenylate kinase family enzyme
MEIVTVAFFGISGSGKGTQAALLEKFLKHKDPSRAIVRPEMGNLLRSFRNIGTPFAKMVDQILQEGGLVPSFMPIHLLTVHMNAHFDGSQHAIFDGVARRPDQARALDDMIRIFKRTKVHAIELKLTREAAKQRLVSRGRFDDAKDDAIENRFSWYEAHVVPAYEELKKAGWEGHEIDGSPDMEVVHETILAALGLS